MFKKMFKKKAHHFRAVSTEQMSSADQRREYNRIWARVSRAQKKNTRDGEPNELQNHNDQEMYSDDSPGSGGGCTIEEQLHDDTNIVPETELEQMETSEDSCDGDEDSAVASSFREQLKEWAIDFGEKHNAVDALLKVHRLKFSVVHFLEENEVDVAPSLWLAKSNGVLNCYWPANNASVLVRRCALPDKVLWKKYKVCVFSDSYSLARERARKGQDTSQVETVEINSRRINVPARYQEPDSDVPSPPIITPVRVDDEGMAGVSAAGIQPHNISPCESSTIGGETYEAFQEIFSFLEGMERRIMLKLERMHEDLRNGNGRVMEAVESRPGRTSEAAEEDMLEGPCQNLADLEDLCKKIADRSFKKKMIRHLSLLGGSNVGDGVRRMLKKIGTNELWKGFSLKGRKGKRPFHSLLIYDVVIRACSRTFPNVDCQKVEEAIAVTLKHAPHRRSTNQVLIPDDLVEDEDEEEEEEEEEGEE
ncbi:unnamed protein product [Arctogadus glacialis]